jgi:hypothetical protein
MKIVGPSYRQTLTQPSSMECCSGAPMQLPGGTTGTLPTLLIGSGIKQSAFHSPLRARRYVMKTVTLAALAVIGAGLAASSTSAAPINPGLAGISPDQPSNVIQVGQKHWSGNDNWKWRRHRHHDNDFRFGFGFGAPFVGLGVAPYYYDRPDCMGWWHRHRSGRLHCHGQLVYDY